VFSQPPWQDYAQALVTEIEYYATKAQYKNRSIESIFFGGGTPSLAPAQLFEDVISTIKRNFRLASDAEITLEANPGASEAERFKAYRQAGINRISIGVQSFDGKELKWLERIHSADEAIQAYQMARDAGFENINLDLMYALPHQTLDEWFVSLNKALMMKPEHLSCYQLTVEPHTALHVTHKKQALALPDEDLALEFFWQTRQRLADAGYQAYEVSNFARQDKHCRHNCGYWLYDDYIGIGAGAAGKWDLANGGVHRYSNIRSPNAYMEAVQKSGFAINSDETLNKQQAMGEAMWLGLRQSQGVDKVWFEQRFHTAISQAYPILTQQWVNQGHLFETNTSIRLTKQGLSLADEVSASFLIA